MLTSIPKPCNPSEQLREYAYSTGINFRVLNSQHQDDGHIRVLLADNEGGGLYPFKINFQNGQPRILILFFSSSFSATS